MRCPFCGADDEGHHMGISLEGRGWRCWRNREHRGKSPARLVAALLGIGLDEAWTIVGRPRVLTDNFLARVKGQLSPEPVPAPPKKIEILPEFRPLGSPGDRPFVSYLGRRGYSPDWCHQEACHYGMYYCLRGHFRYRIIFLVHFERQLVTWTGRSIADNPLRYDTLTHNPDKAREQGLPCAHGPITNYLLWYDDLMQSTAHTIVLCEGPFDALRMRVIGRPYGVEATCFFTAGPSDRQIDLLHSLLPRYRRRILLLDAGTEVMSLRLQGILSSLDVTPKTLIGTKDPALLTADQLLALDIIKAKQ